jgi:hypothetical protein
MAPIEKVETRKTGRNWNTVPELGSAVADLNPARPSP